MIAEVEFTTWSNKRGRFALAPSTCLDVLLHLEMDLNSSIKHFTICAKGETDPWCIWFHAPEDDDLEF